MTLIGECQSIYGTLYLFSSVNRALLNPHLPKIEGREVPVKQFPDGLYPTEPYFTGIYTVLTTSTAE